MGETFELKNPEGGNDEGSDVLIPDKTTLKASVVKIKTVEKPYRDEETGDKVKRVTFRFKVTEEGPYIGKNVFGETSTSFVDHPNCKLRAWVGEILDVDQLPEGFAFNTDDFVDAPCRIVVEQYNFKDAKNNNKVEYRNRVTDVLHDEATQLVSASAVANTLGATEEDFGEEPF